MYLASFFLSFFLLLTAMTPAEAAWSAAEYKHLEQASNKNSLFFFEPSSDDVYQTTVSPIAWIRVKGLLGWYDNPPAKLSAFLAPNHAAKAFLYNEVVTAPDKPWVILVPGIFALLDSEFTIYNAQIIAQQGYNIAYMANPFTEDYQQSKPYFYPGQIDREAEVSCGLVQHILKKYSRSQVSIVGVSYGGLLATATAASCPNSVSRIISMNPPLDLRISFEQVKNMVAEMKTTPDLYKEVISNNESWLYFKSMIFPSYTSKHFFTRFFVEWFAYSIYYLPEDKMLRAQLIPKGLTREDEKFTEWLLSFPLENLFENYDKVLHKKSQQQTQLVYWLNLLQDKKVDYSVVTSLDDPINRKDDWAKLPSQIPKTAVFMLPKGAHLGVADSKWFSELIRIVFGSRDAQSFVQFATMPELCTVLLPLFHSHFSNDSLT